MGWRLGGPKGAREMLSSRASSPFFGAQPQKQELGLGDLSSLGSVLASPLPAPTSLRAPVGETGVRIRATSHK